MFSSIFGSFPSQPNILVRLPNDETTFNPNEYPNVVFRATGKVNGKVHLIHGDNNDDNEKDSYSSYSVLGRISTRVFVLNESDKDSVHITVSQDNKTHSVLLQAPESWTNNFIRYETTVQLPRSTQRMQSLVVEATNTSLLGERLQSLAWGSIRTALSNGSIRLSDVDSETLELRTTNGAIAGTYEAGHAELQTLNGSITAKVCVRDAQDGRQSHVSTWSQNAAIDLHVDAASKTTRGLDLQAHTSNGRLTVGALIGKAMRPSSIQGESSNGRIAYSVDASQSGQALRFKNWTTNGSIASSVMVPVDHVFEGAAVSSNGSVTVNLSEDFYGRFNVKTSNSKATVEGSEIHLEKNTSDYKYGTRGSQGQSEIDIKSSNASASLHFYPRGDSLASANAYGSKEY
ncbi:hypothetical protein BGZ94_008668 [Podila epigama]|nr:hypothetical protein BGZ94_008668 [Podila epigama]